MSLKCERRTSPQGPDDGDATRPVAALSTDRPVARKRGLSDGGRRRLRGGGLPAPDRLDLITAQQAASLQRLGDAKDRVPVRIDQLLLLDPDRDQQIAVVTAEALHRPANMSLPNAADCGFD